MRGNNLSVAERDSRRRRSQLILKCVIAAMLLIAAGLAALLVYDVWIRDYHNPWSGAAQGNAGGSGEGSTTEGVSLDENNEGTLLLSDQEEQSLESRANLLAMQYDYDSAISLLQSQPGYDRDDRLKRLAAAYQTAKAGCRSYPVDQVTHVFFHTLVWDDAKAFDGDEDSAGYNQVMTTVSEFNSIISQMYNRGYVMVSLHDMIDVSPDGSVTVKEILLPEGKTPFVLSQDDCSYYHYMDGDGFASRLIVTEDGRVKNTYTEDDGSVSTGDYDVVPIIDSFVEQHPDFAYHGHKGILALTGYEGVLGYRTDEVYKTRQADRLTKFQSDFFETHPDFDFDKEVSEATEVADAMKAEGWEFASHTWGHINPLQHTLEEVKQDTERWKNWVEPITGETDVLIFAFGADISDWQPYTSDNEYFVYYKSEGFDIYCNVDASVTAWVQIGSDYMRQGRRNLDGYRMYYTPELLSDLFDVDSAWDSNRPTPVPEM